MNRETTDKIGFMQVIRKVDNNRKDTQGAFRKPIRPLYVTNMRYLGECSDSGCAVLFIVQWQVSKQII